MARNQALLCCKVYISEGRSAQFLQKLEALTEASGISTLIQRVSDPIYHRSSFALGGQPQSLVQAALKLVGAAVQQLDLEKHDGTHPRVGIVDHIAVHPLGTSGLEAAREVALTVGRRMAEDWSIPVLFYGACNGNRLADVRRSTNYFKGPKMDHAISSDLGPRKVDPRLGIACVGAVAYVQNYNIRLKTKDRNLAVQVTKALRSSHVEALTLSHASGDYESACNLLDVSVKPPEHVLAEAKEAAGRLGIQIDHGYTVGYTEDEILLAVQENCREIL